jgi:hypothetical protein
MGRPMWATYTPRGIGNKAEIRIGPSLADTGRDVAGA